MGCYYNVKDIPEGATYGIDIGRNEDETVEQKYILVDYVKNKLAEVEKEYNYWSNKHKEDHNISGSYYKMNYYYGQIVILKSLLMEDEEE